VSLVERRIVSLVERRSVSLVERRTERNTYETSF
jgi:hypothetical protein